MTPLHLSRVRLRSGRGEVLSAIAPLLIPEDGSKRAGHAHRVIWLLFQDIVEADRDFLWRDEGDGRYLVLSPRPPSDQHGLFEIDSKEFAPALAAGDRLRFSLRANPTVARKGALDEQARASRTRGKRVDVVMDAIYSLPKGERAEVRDQLAHEAGTAWLQAQGERSGFKLTSPPEIGGYAQIPVERTKGRRPVGFSVLDFAGELEIIDPSAFLTKLASGFGGAKAFGNGLMLIRRA
jgi:CRISPR system Cascade subunit CasE